MKVVEQRGNVSAATAFSIICAEMRKHVLSRWLNKSTEDDECFETMQIDESLTFRTMILVTARQDAVHNAMTAWMQNN